MEENKKQLIIAIVVGSELNTSLQRMKEAFHSLIDDCPCEEEFMELAEQPLLNGYLKQLYVTNFDIRKKSQVITNKPRFIVRKII